MIFRISGKLGKKINDTPTQSLPLDPNPFADWSATLFTADRTQYILITNTASLYSMVMYGRGITNDSVFLQRMISFIGEVLRDDGHRFIFERLVVPSTGRVRFSKALNRSVIGSMNDLVKIAKSLLVVDQLSPYETSLQMNTVPMGMLKYDHPKNAFTKLGLKETGASDHEDNATNSHGI